MGSRYRSSHLSNGTVLCLQPLDKWLDWQMDRDFFFAFSNPGEDRLLSSWFLCANRTSYLMEVWALATEQYWAEWKWRRPYYWFHYLFADLYSSDLRFKAAWDKAQKIPADLPHHFVPFRKSFFQEATRARIDELESLNSPVLKLTYKCLKDGYPKNSMIDYILNER